MKATVLLLFFLGLTHLMQGQEFIQTLAEETCECLSNKSVEGLNQQEKEMQMGVCMLEGVGRHKEAFDEYRKGKSFEDMDLEKFGEEVGIYMATICPLLVLDYADPSYFESDEPDLGVELGKINSIEKKQFNIVSLEVGDGSILKFLWLWDFEGSDVLIKNQYKNKWVNIYYFEYPLYDPDKKVYVNYKVIEGIALGE